jgi:arginase
MNTFHIISANCNQGQQKDGVANGPVILMKLINQITNNRSSVANTNNTIIPNEFFSNNDGYKILYNTHLNLLNSYGEKSNPVITLGGDHSIGHSTVSSSLSKFNDNLLVIWIDAHADLNTHETSITKNTHGMPVSGLIGLEPNWISSSVPILNPKNLIYFGIRDLDTAEVDFINNLGIRSFIDLNRLIEYLDTIDITNKKIHISFDIDSLDPLDLNSTGTTAKGGLKPSDIIGLYKHIKSKTNIVGLDIVELNPDLGDLELSKQTLQTILKDVLV